MRVSILTIDWWTQKRSILQAIVLYVVMLVLGTILAGTVGVLLSEWLSGTQRLYIGPWLNLFLGVGFTLLVSQRKTLKTRFLCALVSALVGLLGQGAILTVLVPTIVSMFPNSIGSKS